jgi:hypothetical protein
MTAKKSTPRKPTKAKKSFRRWAILDDDGKLYDVAYSHEMERIWAGQTHDPYRRKPPKKIRRCTVTLD